MNNYIDIYGRVHNRPIGEFNSFPCNNSFLFSGELSLLAPVNKAKITHCWNICQTEFGYMRNPDNKTFPISSHDELMGMAMLFDEEEAKALYKKLEQQLFQVCNLQTFVPVPLHKLNILKAIRSLNLLRKEENARKATYKHPYILPITQRIQPQHTYFLARCALIRPSFIHSAYFFASSLFTIFGKSNSGKVMLNFKLLKTKKLGQTLSEKLLSFVYEKKLSFAQEVYNYFPEDHPIVEAVLLGAK